MDAFVITVQEMLETVSSTPQKNHPKTGDIRKIAADLFKSLDDQSKAHVFMLCETLLMHNDWAMGVIAYDFAYRMRKYYEIDDFNRFESWLNQYVSGWGDCDDFCTHAFGSLLNQYPILFDKVCLWTTHDAFWVRRAAAVIMIPMIRKGHVNFIQPFKISDALMHDTEPLVLKGYGWMLKVLSTKHEDAVFEYLVKHQDTMPRVSYRYAMEKMSPERKARLIAL
ncbi:DNA alkylation repair protein [Erysipelothrix larvae]|nr:DNA alkylation repair protein [Erysipelothrix larvae]